MVKIEPPPTDQDERIRDQEAAPTPAASDEVTDLRERIAQLEAAPTSEEVERAARECEEGTPTPRAIAALLRRLMVIGTEVMVFTLYDLRLIPERWPDWHYSLLIRTVLVGSIVSILGLRYLLMAHRAEMESRAEQEARMQALQSRIRPHFLFNSMNSIASLMRSDRRAPRSRSRTWPTCSGCCWPTARKLVPISAEREISRQYLEIEKLRLGDRLKVNWQVNNVPRSALIPALTLQPLLENAIYHGIEPRFQGGTLRIELWGEGETLNIMIRRAPRCSCPRPRGWAGR